MRTFFLLLCLSYVLYRGAEFNYSLLQMGHLAKGGCSHGRGDERPPWTRDQPVLPAEVVAPTPLSMRAAISVDGEAQIVRLGVKIFFSSSTSWYDCDECEFKPNKKEIDQSLLSV